MKLQLVNNIHYLNNPNVTADIWRQVWDQGFIVNLNKLCVGQIYEDVELFLKSEFIDKNFYPKHWLYIFTETYPLFQHNETQQKQ